MEEIRVQWKKKKLPWFLAWNILIVVVGANAMQAWLMLKFPDFTWLILWLGYSGKSLANRHICNDCDNKGNLVVVYEFKYFESAVGFEVLFDLMIFDGIG